MASKQKNKKKPKKAKQTPPKKRGNRHKNRIGGVPKTIISAPVSEMAVVRSGVKAYFTGQGDGFRFKIRFRIGQIRANGTGVSFWVYGDGTAADSQDIQFYPANPEYFPPYITSLVDLFELWELFSVILEYEPRSITSSSAAFVIAGCEDPMWPESRGQLTSGYTDATENALASLADSCTVISYGRCRLPLPVNKGRAKGNKLYVAGYAGGLLNYNTVEASIIRDCTGAVAMIQGQAGNQTDGTILGDLYCEMDLGLYNFTTSLNAGVTRQPSEKKSVAMHPSVWRKPKVGVSTMDSPVVLQLPKSSSKK